MVEGVERLLPVLAEWGVWIFATAVVAAVIGMVRLGRGRRMLLPLGWRARVASLLLLAGAIVACLGLFVVLGPMQPVLAQVRYVRGIVDHPARELAYRAVSDDTPHRLSDLRGQVVVLNLWATWCGPCRRELPDMGRIARDYAPQGLTVVTLSTEARERLLAFAGGHPAATLNVYAGRTGWLDVRGRPLTLLIDREGVVRDVMIGACRYEELERKVRPLLEESTMTARQRVARPA